MLELVITILSVAVIGLSIWGLMYFGFRLAFHWWTRRHLGDMPSADEIAELCAAYDRYDRNLLYSVYHNPEILLNHSPTQSSKTVVDTNHPNTP